MYFANRVQAGRMLAAQLLPKYRYENCAVVALSDGGVVVGAQIAMQLHCVINMLLYEEIKLPQELQAISGISSDGSYVYNSYYQESEIRDMVDEYRNYLEQEKINKLQTMTKLLGNSGVMRTNMLKGHNIILVSDALWSPFALDLAAEYLKPLSYAKLIVATPMATVPVVDRMHVLADDIYCLSVTDGTFEPNHYYDNNDLPDHEHMVDVIQKIILNWK